MSRGSPIVFEIMVSFNEIQVVEVNIVTTESRVQMEGGFNGEERGLQPLTAEAGREKK